MGLDSDRLDTAEQSLAIEQLSESQLGGLRLRSPEQLRQLKRSLQRHGQLEPVLAYGAEPLEIIDGFKRLHVARQLGWKSLRARVAELDAIEAKLLVAELHERRGLTALEQGWLIRSLCREEGLSQGAVGERLGRHKSWVCRRLLLVEQLEDTVQADVRLGLLSARAAVALTALPRGNQQAAAAMVIRRGLTVRQTERLAAELAREPVGESFTRRLESWTEGRAKPGVKRESRARTQVESW